MFEGETINEFVDRLETGKVYLYHACQLVDVRTYLQLGGIPSRNLMEGSGSAYTRFETDAVDVENAVWDKVFVNLHDFGASFAMGRIAVPNVYGPILIRARPESLLDADDVAVCLRSAGAQGFHRERESVPADRMADLFNEAGQAKFGSHLRDIFEDAHEPEISCTFHDELIPCRHWAYIVVEPSPGDALAAAVEGALHEAGAKIKVYERDKFADHRRDAYVRLLERLAVADCPLRELIAAEDCAAVAAWARSILEAGLEYQFRRFSRYIREGTLSTMQP
jgi:hypothetical protein